jgi:D-glycero-D-manno-heptose 1,7-bisphosphate phosphatase
VGRALIERPGVEAAVDIAFLDRDGTLNVRVEGYVSDPGDLELLPGAAAAVARLNRAGVPVVLVTNQRGLSDGRLSRAQWVRVMRRLDALLAEEGAHLDHVEVCPHAADTCQCRKPGTGMFEAALSLAPWADPSRCVMIGDMPSDVVPARLMGMRAWQLGVDAASVADVVDHLLGERP